MTWRTALLVIEAKFAGKVSPTLSRQEARKLMREVARNAAQVEKLRARKGTPVKRVRSPYVGIAPA